MKWREEIKPTRTDNFVTVRPGSNRQHGSFLDTLSPVIFKKSWLRLVSSQWLRLVPCQWFRLVSSQYRLIYAPLSVENLPGPTPAPPEGRSSWTSWRRRGNLFYTPMTRAHDTAAATTNFPIINRTQMSVIHLILQASPPCHLFLFHVSKRSWRNQNWSAEIAVREFTRHRHHS